MTLFLLFYRIQDVCLIFALISLVLSFFSTYAFQVSCFSRLFAFKSFCTLHCVAFRCCLYVIFGWSGWTAVWPAPSYNYHQHNISHPDYHVAQLVAKWAMGTSTGVHMARWSDLAVCYPETLWVSPIICWSFEAAVIWDSFSNHDIYFICSGCVVLLSLQTLNAAN